MVVDILYIHTTSFRSLRSNSFWPRAFIASHGSFGSRRNSMVTVLLAELRVL